MTCPSVLGDDVHVQGGGDVKQVLQLPISWASMHICTCKGRSTVVCGLSLEAVELIVSNEQHSPANLKECLIRTTRVECTCLGCPDQNQNGKVYQEVIIISFCSIPLPYGDRFLQ